MISEKKTHLIYLITFLIVSLISRGQTFGWVKQMGGAEWDEGKTITTDNLGNVYIAGEFKDTTYFDPGIGNTSLIAGGNRDIFISKFDASGNLIWAKQIGGSQTTSREHVNAIVIDDHGSIYVTGSFMGITDFDPGTNSFFLTSSGNGVHTAFICKLDQLGDFVWVKQFGGSLASESKAIAVDQIGNVYTTGFFDGTVDFDPDTTSVYNLTVVEYSDIFISKLDSLGNFVWAKQFGGIQGGVGYSIALDENGNVYTTGTVGGTVDFDPGPGTFYITPSVTSTEIYISKIDSLGDFVWAKPMGPGAGYTIAIDENSNVYSSGWTPSGYTPVINKLDSSGNLLWAKQLGGIDGNYIALDNSGNVYTTGNCFGTNDFDPGPGVFNLVAGSSDSYISKLDTSGNFVWAGLLKSVNQVWAKSMAIDANDNLYTTGFFNGTADFDPNTTTSFNLSCPPTNYDVFVLKLEPNNSVGIWENSLEDKIRIYPNPTFSDFKIFGKNIAQINICSLDGKNIITKNYYNQQTPIKLSLNDYPDGLYFLHIIFHYTLLNFLKCVSI